MTRAPALLSLRASIQHKKNIVKCFKNHHYQGLKHQAPKQDHASELEGKVHSCAEKVEEKKMGNSALQHARHRNSELVHLFRLNI